MTLNELRDAVIEEVKRPDKATLIVQKVKEATLTVHTAEYWDKDLYEVGVTFPSLNYLQRLMYKEVIPRYRSLKYIRRVDATSLEPYGPNLTVIKPEAFMDDYNVERDNVCYQSGLSIQIRTSEACSHFLLGCYLLPDVTDGGFSSWIADENPWAIVYRAAASLSRSIGFTDQAQSFLSQAGEQLAILRVSNVVADGY